VVSGPFNTDDHITAALEGVRAVAAVRARGVRLSCQTERPSDRGPGLTAFCRGEVRWQQGDKTLTLPTLQASAEAAIAWI